MTRPLAGVAAPIVLIGDDGPTLRALADILDRESFEVVLDVDGDAALDLRATEAGAAIVDLAMSARPGLDVCAAWRARSEAPLVARTVRHDEHATLAAFDAGVDHVIDGDVSGPVLVAHLRALLRRCTLPSAPTPPPTTSIDVDEDARCAIVGGIKVALLDDELSTLSLLVRRGERIVTRAELVAMLFPKVSSRRQGRVVDALVRRLREKLERVEPYRRITVVRGVGFRFEVDPAALESDVIDLRERPTKLTVDLSIATDLTAPQAVS